MHMQVDELHEFNHGIGRAANRLSGAMAIAAVIVGSSIAMTVEGRPTLLGGGAFRAIGLRWRLAGRRMAAVVDFSKRRPPLSHHFRRNAFSHHRAV